MRIVKFIIVIGFVLLSVCTNAATFGGQYIPQYDTALEEGYISVSDGANMNEVFSEEEYIPFSDNGMPFFDDETQSSGLLGAPPPGGGDWNKAPIGDATWVFIPFMLLYVVQIFRKKINLDKNLKTKK